MSQPSSLLCICPYLPPPPDRLDPAGTAQSVSATRVSVLLTQLSGHVCLAVVPNSWDYEEVPLPHVSAQML